MNRVPILFAVCILCSCSLAGEPWLKAANVYYHYADGQQVLQKSTVRMVNENCQVTQEICSKVSASGMLEPYSTTRYEYEETLLVRQTFCAVNTDASSGADCEIEFFYNDQNQLIKEASSRSGEEASFSDFTFYTYQGDLLVKKSNFISVEEYVYNEKKQLVLSRAQYGDVVLERIYENGFLSKEQRITENSEVRPDVQTTRFEYKNGLLRRASVFSGERRLLSYTEYAYNEKNLLVEEKFFRVNEPLALKLAEITTETEFVPNPENNTARDSSALQTTESAAKSDQLPKTSVTADVADNTETGNAVLVHTIEYDYAENGLLLRTTERAKGAFAEENTYAIITEYEYGGL